MSIEQFRARYVAVSVSNDAFYISKTTHQLGTLGQGCQPTSIDPSHQFICTWLKILSGFKYTAKSSQTCPKLPQVLPDFRYFTQFRAY